MSKLTIGGIDWTDVGTLMSGLQGIHECTVELTVRTVGQRHSGSLATTALAWIPTFDAAQTLTIGELTREWPNKTHPTFDNFVFNLLYDLDREIGRQYAQAKLPE
jgi:hypothetical protein